MGYRRNSLVFAAAVLLCGESAVRAQGSDASWAAPATIQADQALKSSAARQALAAASSAAPIQDVPKIRETVRRLTVSVEINCADEKAGYALRPVSADLGPSFSAYGASLQSDYLYPQKSGLSLALKVDGAAAALWIGNSETAMRKLGTIVPAAGVCRARSADTDLSLDAAVSAALSVETRPGLFRPACYKDIINGFYKLDTWTVLTLAFPEGPLTVKTADSEAFPDESTCRSFYEQVKANL